MTNIQVQKDSATVKRAIEEAEISILRLSKTAVLNLYTKTRFYKEVDEIISRALADIPKDAHDRFIKTMRLYAAKSLKRERDVMLLHAGFVFTVMSGVENKVRGARQYEKVYQDALGNDYLNSRGFKAALRNAPTIYNITSPTAVPLNVYHREYMKNVRDLTEELIRADAKEDYTTNVSLRNVAEAQIRLEHQEKMISDLRANGTKLAYIVPHANCSKRCEKYQVGGSYHSSGLYSLDGTSGTTAEGVKYIPLEEATNNPDDRYTTAAGVTYQNGCLTGFNCRHILRPYEPNVKVAPIPAGEIKKRREIEEKQRSMERRIRELRRAHIVENNPKEARKIKANIKNSYEEYRAFCRDNHVTAYIERTRLFE